LYWDFALILFILAIIVPALGRRRVRVLFELRDTSKADRLSLYASTIALQWLFAAVILWRVSRHAIRPEQLGLSFSATPTISTITVVLANAIFALQLTSLRRLKSDPGALTGETIQIALKVFPRDGIERLCFTVLVCTVAICEEFIYRGFVQYLFKTWSGSLSVGIAGSSLLFSVAHLYQGKRGLVSTFGVGALFAGVRAWTGSLVPTVIAHFVADLTIGLLAPRRMLAALAVVSDGKAASQTHSDLSSGTSRE
jgi:uncharacterized protein